MTGFKNTYEDDAYAAAYARMEFPGTYYLAYRDLPEILSEHVSGTSALDFGCGAGRSSRFLKKLGFGVIGIDIAPEMIRHAEQIDPEGDYRLVSPGSLGALGSARFDLILAAFPFDNIPMAIKPGLFEGLAGLLTAGGRIVNLASTPDIYTNEWASFSTKDFPENKQKQPGEIVKVICFDIDDQTIVEDIVCDEAEYQRVYAQAGLRIVESRLPLGRQGEPTDWVSEETIAPWRIDVLEKS